MKYLLTNEAGYNYKSLHWQLTVYLIAYSTNYHLKYEMQTYIYKEGT